MKAKGNDYRPIALWVCEAYTNIPVHNVLEYDVFLPQIWTARSICKAARQGAGMAESAAELFDPPTHRRETAGRPPAHYGPPRGTPRSGPARAIRHGPGQARLTRTPPRASPRPSSLAPQRHRALPGAHGRKVRCPSRTGHGPHSWAQLGPARSLGPGPDPAIEGLPSLSAPPRSPQVGPVL